MPSRILRLWNPDLAAWEEVGDSRLSAHLAAGDPHPVYLSQSEGDAAYLPLAHAPGTDPHPQYLTAAEGTGAFLPLTGGTVTGDLILQGATPSANSLRLRAAGDTNPRLLVDASGQLSWGPGAVGSLDVTLRRFSTTELVTNATLLTSDTTRDVGRSATRWRKLWAQEADLSGPLTVAGDVTLSEATPTLSLKQAADTQPRARLTDTALAFGPGGATAPDATLARTGPGALRVDTNLGVGAAPVAWHAARFAVQLGGGASLAGNAGAGGATLSDNSYLNASAQATALITGAAGRLAMNGAGTISLENAPSVAAGAAQTFTTRAAIAPTGTLTLTPDAGALHLVAGNLLLGPGNGAAPRVASQASQNLELYGNSGSVTPNGDGGNNLGSPSVRWGTFYAVTGTINTSSRQYKEGITPLDPALALEAVRSTPAVTFTYTAPEQPPEWYDLPDDPEQAQQVLEQRLTSAPLEAAARHQAGFVSEDADPLFLVGEGQTSPGNSVGVLLAALQYETSAREALEARVQALEGA